MADILTIIEDKIPGFDIIPTFTLMWIYTYVYKKEELKPGLIEVKK